MSTAARKARKRAGIKFERTPKVATAVYETRSARQERRRAELKVQRAATGLVGQIVGSLRGAR